MNQNAIPSSIALDSLNSIRFGAARVTDRFMCPFNRVMQRGGRKRAADFDVREANTAGGFSGTARY